MQKENLKKHGFTLAEILITLTVIGVVAALTIPTLLQNTNQAELKTALKRDFADLSQATEMIKIDAGGSLVNAFKNGAGGDLDDENLKNAYKSKLSIIKDCSGPSNMGGSGQGAKIDGCWHADNNWKYLNGTLLTTLQYPGLILSNGTLMLLGINKSDCTYPAASYTKCGAISFDVNGFKPPNMYGKDIFQVNITADSLIPTGAKGYCDPASDCDLSNISGINQGRGCTARYLYE